mmetsp:Transcript_56076/g.149616  ORF Transcript_56076/g.149616 Transcript_56076/m.149616 type:complete len:397 (-) Transcript_56076:791-1981(-)
MEMKDDDITEIWTQDGCEHRLRKQELVSGPCHPKEVRHLDWKLLAIVRRSLLPRSSYTVDDRGQERQKRCDAHTSSNGDKDLVFQRRLGGCSEGSIEGQLGKFLPHPGKVHLVSGYNDPSRQFLGPVTERRNDEVNRVILFTRTDGEGMPLPSRILRHADERVHAWTETPETRGLFHLQIHHGPTRNSILARSDGGRPDCDIHGAIHVKPHTSENTIRYISNERNGGREHSQWHTNPNPSVAPVDVHEHWPQHDGDVVEIPEALEVHASCSLAGHVGNNSQQNAKQHARKPNRRHKKHLLHILVLYRDRTSGPRQVRLTPEPEALGLWVGATQDTVQFVQFRKRVVRLHYGDDCAHAVTKAMRYRVPPQHPPKENVEFLVSIKHAADPPISANDVG